MRNRTIERKRERERGREKILSNVRNSFNLFN